VECEAYSSGVAPEDGTGVPLNEKIKPLCASSEAGGEILIVFTLFSSREAAVKLLLDLTGQGIGKYFFCMK
jgi:hypothetical protein